MKVFPRKLNNRQQERIRHSGEIEGAREGRVFHRLKKQVGIEDEQGRHHTCHIRANLAGQDDVVVGDRVLWQAGDGGDGVILSLLPRAQTLMRADKYGDYHPVVSHVDGLLIVAAAEPLPRGNLINHFFVAAREADIDPLLVVNKSDLDLERAKKAIAAEVLDDTPPLEVSALTGAGLPALLERLEDRQTAVIGQSGVGKSTLIGRLCKESIKTAKLSAGAGVHTTTTAHLYPLAASPGNLIDLPGMSKFALGEVDEGELAHCFPKVAELVAACHFRNCTHGGEKDCALRAEIEKGRWPEEKLLAWRELVAQCAVSFKGKKGKIKPSSSSASEK